MNETAPAAPVAGLEERLRERAQMFLEDFDGAEDNCGNVVDYEELAALDIQAADALAAKDAIIEKTRVALEEVRWGGANGTCPATNCYATEYAPLHKLNCPIAAALEAMGK